MRDFQKSRVYAWETKYVSPCDRNYVSYENVQAIIDYVWKEEGLENPPRIKPMPKQDKKALSKANRYVVYVREDGMPTWVILHELSHSLTYDVETDGCNWHCEDFVGIYMKLLEKYLGINIHELMFTAKNNNVKFNITATPYCK